MDEQHTQIVTYGLLSWALSTKEPPTWRFFCVRDKIVYKLLSTTQFLILPPCGRHGFCLNKCISVDMRGYAQHSGE